MTGQSQWQVYDLRCSKQQRIRIMDFLFLKSPFFLFVVVVANNFGYSRGDPWSQPFTHSTYHFHVFSKFHTSISIIHPHKNHGLVCNPDVTFLHLFLTIKLASKIMH